MGTDIHMYIEKQQANGSWKALPAPKRNYTKYPGDGYFWGPHGCFTPGKCYGTDEDECEGKDCDACEGTGKSLSWYRSRDYNVFAILADVRNGHGFAGIDTGDGFNVIAPQRGMPEDVSDVIRNYHSWDHSESWLLLSEVLAFDWTQTTKHRGVIPLRSSVGVDSYEDWKRRGGGCPKAWSGSVSGPGIVIVSAVEADGILAMSPDAIRYYVSVEWEETYAESAASFLAFVSEFVENLGDPNRLGTDIRLVFGFDS